MKIGIIVYSETNNTYSVGERLQEKLMADGHDVDVERVITVGNAPLRSKNIENIEFEALPDVNLYDVLIFGAPVHAFSTAAVMKAYLEQITTLMDKKVACFVTKMLPFNWTGGNQAISKMKKICESKGGTVVGTGIVVWRGGFEKQINELNDKFSPLFD